MFFLIRCLSNAHIDNFTEDLNLHNRHLNLYRKKTLILCRLFFSTVLINFKLNFVLSLFCNCTDVDAHLI
jgi:hypothetical protein